MMCVRAIGSLPSRRLSISGTMLASAMSATMRNIAAFSAASRLYARCRTSRALRRAFCAARMPTIVPFGIAGWSSSPNNRLGA